MFFGVSRMNAHNALLHNAPARRHPRRDPHDHHDHQDHHHRARSPTRDTSPPSDLKSIKKLGEDGQATAELVHSHKHNTLLVLKILKPHHKSSLIEREIHILRDILPKTPHIISFMGAIPSPTNTKLLFGYCPGGDLDQLVKHFHSIGCRPPESLAWHIFEQLAKAVAFLHYGYDEYARDPLSPPPNWRRVVHRDIKPDNIFLRTKFRPSSSSILHSPEKIPPRKDFPALLLGDFGLATTETVSTALASIYWQPPSTTRTPTGDQFVHTARGDVWGVGACIHAMVHDGEGPVRDVPPVWERTEWYYRRRVRGGGICRVIIVGR